MPNFGAWEWIVILVIVLVIFVGAWLVIGRGLRRWIVDIGRETRKDEDEE